MHPTLAKIVEHLQNRHAGSAEDLSAVIKECSAAGFAPGLIIAGLVQMGLVPHGEAKGLVVSHLFSDKARSELDQLHSQAELALHD